MPHHAAARSPPTCTTTTPRAGPSADDLIDRMNAAGGDAVRRRRRHGRRRRGRAGAVPGPVHLPPGPSCSWPATTSCGRTAPTATPRSPTTCRGRVRALGWHWLEGDPFVARRRGRRRHGRVVRLLVRPAGSWASPTGSTPPRCQPRGGRPAGAAFAPCSTPRGRRPAASPGRWSPGGTTASSSSWPAGPTSSSCTRPDRLDALRPSLAAVAAVDVRGRPPASRSASCCRRRTRPSGTSSRPTSARPALGHVLLTHPNVKPRLLRPQPPAPRGDRSAAVRAVNVGSGYRVKTFCTVDV